MRCCETARSVSSGSNLRRSTSVEESGRASVKWAKPQEWNIGAAIIVVSRALSGIFENSAAAGSSVSGCARAAPFGCPVVPEVRITTRPVCVGARTSESALRAISSSSTGSACLAPGSLQAMKRILFAAPSRTSSANSSS